MLPLPLWVEQLAKSTDGGLSEFQKIYADYNITSCEAVYYEQTGCFVTVHATIHDYMVMYPFQLFTAALCKLVFRH